MELAGIVQQVQTELIGHVDARNAVDPTKVSDVAPPEICRHAECVQGVVVACPTPKNMLSHRRNYKVTDKVRCSLFSVTERLWECANMLRAYTMSLWAGPDVDTYSAMRARMLMKSLHCANSLGNPDRADT